MMVRKEGGRNNRDNFSLTICLESNGKSMFKMKLQLSGTNKIRLAQAVMVVALSYGLLTRAEPQMQFPDDPNQQNRKSGLG